MRNKNILKIIVLWLVIAGVSVGAYYYFKENQAQKEAEIQEAKHQTAIQPQITIYKAKDGSIHAKKETRKTVSLQEPVTKEYETYVKDTLSKALDLAVDKINELTRVKAKLEGELQATKVELAENKAKRVYYEDKYLSIVTHEDSTGLPKKLQYTYNAELNIAHYSKRKNFWNKERNYIDVSSPDKNFKINGLEHYQKQIYIRPKQVGIGFQFGYGLSQDFKVQPYMGVGLSYNLIRF